MLRAVTDHDNLHTVYMYGGKLCVRCRNCDHRAALAIGRQGIMDTINRLKLVCSTCKSTNVDKWLPADKADLDRFLRGEI